MPSEPLLPRQQAVLDRGGGDPVVFERAACLGRLRLTRDVRDDDADAPVLETPDLCCMFGALKTRKGGLFAAT